MADVSNEAGHVLGHLIQAGRIDRIGLPPNPPRALAGLPPTDREFAGRTDQLATLADALRPEASDAPVVVSAVAGLAGVGKTTLAVRAAHDAQRQGWFPGGVLFANLQGYDPTPATPADTLAMFLRALGVPDSVMPADLAGRQAQYRSLLAEFESVLVVLDNASSADQVRPLLPGTGRHRVLVTSRHTLSDLRARLIDVDVLTDTETWQLVDNALRVAHPDDDRATREPEAVRQLALWCGALPLALRIVVAMLVEARERPIASFLDGLRAEATRLERLSRGKDRVVYRAFALSYARLDPDEARMFRLLSVFRGQSLSLPSAAVLAGQPEPDAGRLLDSLRRAHLIEPAKATGWFRLHDLVRLFAAERLVAQDSRRQRRKAIVQLLDYYLRLTAQTATWLRGGLSQAGPSRFASREDVREWLLSDEFRPIDLKQFRPTHPARLVALLRYYQMLRLSMRALEGFGEVQEAYLDIHLHEVDKVFAGAQQLFAGTDFLRTTAGRLFADAIERLVRADNADPLPGKAGRQLPWFRAMIAYGAGDFDKSVDDFTSALGMYHDRGDRRSEAILLSCLAVVHHDRGDRPAAITACRRAAELYKRSGAQRETTQLRKLAVLLSRHDRGCPLCADRTG